ncbi:MAG: DNA mismatch repair endonuclease MutL [Cyclobacteriaceae bacterium]|nr:DNA mismatch repair endonuclease MutL [Cyclobacteriaceae bacterium]
MTDIIRLLPDSLANQIAAGEVVQRPASAVKELMENAIDAGADHIELIVAEAGKSLIQVVDNGIGMTETDARMSLERHATSKIKSSEDLFAIRTMGFRGEAMASIAAVSQMEITTRQQDQELGTRIEAGASSVKEQSPCSCEKGTSIKVKNLFFNVPARRNFLKSHGVEQKHIIEEFQHIALAYPEKSFNLFIDGEEVFHLQPGKLSQRIVGLFGKSYQNQLAACSTESEFVKVRGYVGKPEFSKKTRGDQYLFVNSRFIKSHYINHAITTAYEGLLPEKQFPFFALFLELDPEHIDVNVHPTKTEIKFDDERTIYAIVRAAVKQALGTHSIMPSLDFSADVNLMRNLGQRETIKDSKYSRFQSPPAPAQGNRENWDTLFDEHLLRQGQHLDRIIDSETTEQGRSVTFQSQAGNQTESLENKPGSLLQLFNEYILSPVKSGLMVIDQRAALERVIFEKFEERADSNKSLSQHCLFPVTIDLNTADFRLVKEIEAELKGLGFNFEEFGGNTIVIQGIPVDIATENEKELFEGVIEQYKNSSDELGLSVREKTLRAYARRSSLQGKRKMNAVEMEELVGRLFRCKNPNYTPGGKPTFKLVERKTIETFFN